MVSPYMFKRHLWEKTGGKWFKQRQKKKRKRRQMSEVGVTKFKDV